MASKLSGTTISATVPEHALSSGLAKCKMLERSIKIVTHVIPPTPRAANVPKPISRGALVGLVAARAPPKAAVAY